MKILYKILWSIVAVMIVTLVVASFLPRECKVQRSILIKSTPEIIFARINNFHSWESWIAFGNIFGDDVTKNFSGNEAGAGSIMSWSGKGTSGKLNMTSVIPQQSVNVEMTIDGQSLKSTNEILIERGKNGMHVTWTAKVDMGWSPVKKIHGLFLDSEIGDDYEKALVSLKHLCEHENEPASV